MNNLVTGCNGHLGSCLKAGLHCSGLNRKNCGGIFGRFRQYNTIIHNAFHFDETNLYKFYNNNFELTQRLCHQSHNLIIYLSTVDIYNQDTLYAHTKKICEAIVKEKSNNYIILRMSSLMGTKPNSITKILNNEPITLSALSTVNCILYEDVIFVIQQLLKQKIVNRTFDLTANEDIEIPVIKYHFNSTTQYGNYTYNVAPGNPQSLYDVVPEINKSSLENIELWRKKYLF